MDTKNTPKEIELQIILTVLNCIIGRWLVTFSIMPEGVKVSRTLLAGETLPEIVGSKTAEWIKPVTSEMADFEEHYFSSLVDAQKYSIETILGENTIAPSPSWILKSPKLTFSAKGGK